VQVPYDPRIVNQTNSPDNPWPISANANKEFIKGNIHLLTLSKNYLMSRLITLLCFLGTVPHNTTEDETALNGDKYEKRTSFNHTVVDETSSSINPGLSPEHVIKGNYNVINKKQLWI
jgi:hypothetical protein